MHNETRQQSIVLASKSPRRRELLQQIGIFPCLVDSEIDETPHADECAKDYVVRLAQSKAKEGFRQWLKQSNEILPVLAADTIVVLNENEQERLLGKPTNRESMVTMLSQLSGGCHRVLTAICVTDGDREVVVVSETYVYFRALSNREINAYCDTGEPSDKAGAYGIQGMAALFIERIEGSYSGVMGLPLCETGLALKQFGVAPLR